MKRLDLKEGAGDGTGEGPPLRTLQSRKQGGGSQTGPGDLRSEGDETLMLRYQGGDTAAFEELYHRHSRGVFSFVLGFTRSRKLAEDLLQEVFLRVIKASGSYEPKAKFSTWLYRIARNLCTDAYRRKRGLKLVSIEERISEEAGGDTLGERLSGREADPQEQASMAETARLIERALERIKPEQTEVFLLRQEGLSFEEIAAVTGVGKNTVKSRMRYALQELRKALEEGPRLRGP